MSNEQIELNNRAYSIVETKDGFKVLELTFDYEKGMIGEVRVIANALDKAEAFERFKIVIAENLM